MRLLCEYWSSKLNRYTSFVYFGDRISDLWSLLSGFGPDVLLKVIKDDDISGGFSGGYIFTVEPNIYIGYEFDGLTEEQSIVLKNDPRYFFKTTKQGFIDLAQQWAKVHEQRPPGISIKEISTDVWEVEPMTEREVANYKVIADPVTYFLSDYETKKPNGS
ncbi:hypothetical protein HOK96_02610 [bacterium]|jgi:hypothetical protein|nr:hypothetical protein [bacterium]MBT3903742.1 hypothetical protein [bacterium]MBT4577912.1 hypothetical protein [bacterium]MBT5345909.1 hypothetical protein [bacterium]MBT6131125.1 hypothetical protein [bacterium]